MPCLKVSIIILNWNGLKDTIECLDSLKKIVYPNYEVIVVDNASTGDDAGVLEKKYAGYIQIIRSKENLGFCGGNNIGMAKAIEDGSDYVLLLNNDTVVEQDFLDKLVEVGEMNGKNVIIGSVIADYYTKKTTFTNAKMDRKLNVGVRTDFLNSDLIYWDTDATHGAAEMFKVKFVQQYNLFLDEKLFLYCDEMDVCQRAKKNGLNVVMAGKSKIYHKEGASVGGSLNPLSVYYTIRNRILLSRILLSPKNRLFFWILFISARAIRLIEWIFKKERLLIKVFFIAFLDGIRGKRGKNNYIQTLIKQQNNE